MSLKSGFFGKIVEILGTGFGLGLSPIVPGTCGSLPGIALVLLISRVGSVPVQALIAIGLSLLAIPIAHITEARLKEKGGKKDDGRVVVDEYLTFPVCMLGLPPHPLMLAIAFVISRICDIIKPPPAYQSQRLKGGLGIVADDFIANIYTLALNWLVFLALRKAQIL